MGASDQAFRHVPDPKFLSGQAGHRTRTFACPGTGPDPVLAGLKIKLPFLSPKKALQRLSTKKIQEGKFPNQFCKLFTYFGPAEALNRFVFHTQNQNENCLFWYYARRIQIQQTNQYLQFSKKLQLWLFRNKTIYPGVAAIYLMTREVAHQNMLLYEDLPVIWPIHIFCDQRRE